MAYRWKNNLDVEEAVVVLMNSLDENAEIPGWLRRTIQQAVYDSDPQYVRRFFSEMKHHAPESLKYFEDPMLSGGD
ncbi:MAG: hypothetical protein GKC04_04040 [Methanomicrobiales archaeon]|nr:hypothetical protein [Methanomicrobiales archaeon]